MEALKSSVQVYMKFASRGEKNLSLKLLNYILHIRKVIPSGLHMAFLFIFIYIYFFVFPLPSGRRSTCVIFVMRAENG